MAEFSTKSALRQKLQRRLRALSPEIASTEASRVTEALSWSWEALSRPPVAGFLSLRHEIDLKAFWQRVWRHNQSVWLPRCREGGRLDWHDMPIDGDYVRGPFGLREPDPSSHPAKGLPPGTLVVVPGLAFGVGGERLGRGAGYYDRTLMGSGGRALLTIGVGFGCQFEEEIPVSSLDRSVDGVCLGGRWIKVPRRGGGG